MSQHELIKKYIQQHGSILPSHVGGKPYLDGFFGSEVSKRCRELRKIGVLRSEPDIDNPKFERFFLALPVRQERDIRIQSREMAKVGQLALI